MIPRAPRQPSCREVAIQLGSGPVSRTHRAHKTLLRQATSRRHHLPISDMLSPGTNERPEQPLPKHSYRTPDNRNTKKTQFHGSAPHKTYTANPRNFGTSENTFTSATIPGSVFRPSHPDTLATVAGLWDQAQHECATFLASLSPDAFELQVARLNLELRTAHLEQRRRIAAWHPTGAVPATTQPTAPIAPLASGLGTSVHPGLASKPPIPSARQSLAGKLGSCAPPAGTADAVPAASHPKPDTAAPKLALAGPLALSANADGTSTAPPQQVHTHDACTSRHDVSDGETAPADGAHDARAPQTASEDLAPHDDAAQALASTASAPQQLPQVTEQTGSAEAKTAGKTPSSDRGMPAANGAASAKSSRAQHAHPEDLQTL